LLYQSGKDVLASAMVANYDIQNTVAVNCQKWSICRCSVLELKQH